MSAPSFLETIERACARARGGGGRRRVFYHLPAASSPPPSSQPQPQPQPPQPSNADASAQPSLSADVLSPDWWSLPAGVVSVEEEEGEGEGGGGEAEVEKSGDAKVVAAASSAAAAASSAAAAASTAAASSPPPSSPSLLEGSYVLVSRDDVVDAVAHFIASYVASLPQSRDLDPKALRSALATTLGELRRGRVKRLWAWGKWLYRAAALSYGAFGAYTNPWLARAVLAALWTSAKVMVAVAVRG